MTLTETEWNGASPETGYAHWQTGSLKVLGAISFSHFLNDTIQSLIFAIYPLLKNNFALTFVQVGTISLVYQITASLLQPMVGFYTDRHPRPYSLAFGMGCTLCGLLVLAMAWNYDALLIAAAMVGMGSSVFHPESSRVARMASGGKYGFAQSIFQVGGNAGTAMGPLMAAWIIIPCGQHSILWFSFLAMLAIVVLINVGHWYGRRRTYKGGGSKGHQDAKSAFSRRTVTISLLILLALIFSKYFYLASITNYFTFYLMHRFHLPMQQAQYYLFTFLFAVATGTLIGGPIGDRIGRKKVIWLSILGAAPFTLALPYANLTWTGILAFAGGFTLASAFSAILVFAQELIPGKVGTISGLFFGLAFGMAGIGAAVLGKLADMYDIEFVYHICSYLPLLGVLAVFLPDIRLKKGIDD
ncbi:MFS transporter [Dissulfurimicrobium hydrothermale]|uniref:MFS transporter n=1 Tax=Dissulfurimicrobium hydrothermale TaxID=1750598 RepID=UPI001EDA2DDB|nr:MFS transporter [Dissulfurimicrobium hydrothermale]UKL14525.1 MFS transporter [Dissulfurimicrobium hydrothermale]